MSMKIKINNLHKVFQKGDSTVDVLKGVNFDIDSGETVAITGPSGSGKTTLLQIIGLLDSPSDGSVNINEKRVQAFWKKLECIIDSIINQMSFQEENAKGLR